MRRTKLRQPIFDRRKIPTEVAVLLEVVVKEREAPVAPAAVVAPMAAKRVVALSGLEDLMGSWQSQHSKGT